MYELQQGDRCMGGFRHLFTVCPLGTCLYNYVHKLECHKLSQARAEPAGIVDIN